VEHGRAEVSVAKGCGMVDEIRDIIDAVLRMVWIALADGQVDFVPPDTRSRLQAMPRPVVVSAERKP
jgi:hypothetical protein